MHDVGLHINLCSNVSEWMLLEAMVLLHVMQSLLFRKEGVKRIDIIMEIQTSKSVYKG